FVARTVIGQEIVDEAPGVGPRLEAGASRRRRAARRAVEEEVEAVEEDPAGPLRAVDEPEADVAGRAVRAVEAPRPHVLAASGERPAVVALEDEAGEDRPLVAARR